MTKSAQPAASGDLPIRMLGDRLLVGSSTGEGERRSGGGIVIPATASVGRRLSWAECVAAGPNVRQVAVGDKILFDPEDRAEVELEGAAYVLLRERDVHAVYAASAASGSTGLYL